MITERALYDHVDIQANLEGQWTPLLADAIGLSIRRGGARDGLGIKTDVGLCTFRLLNAQDPMDGGTLAPGVPVRVITGDSAVSRYTFGFETLTVTQNAASQVYSENFTTDAGGWTAGANTTAVQSLGGSYPNRLAVYRTATAGDFIASRTFTGLTVGRSYTVSVKVNASATGITNARITTAVASGTGVTLTTSQVTRSLTFTANATSMAINFTGTSTGSSIFSYWDDVTLTRDSYASVTGADGWNLWDPESDYNVSDARTGSKGFKNHNGADRTFTGLVPGRNYTFSFWFKTSGGDWAAIEVDSAATAYAYFDDNPLNQWIKRELTFTATATSHNIFFQAYQGVTDDVELLEDARTTIFTGRIAHLNSRYPLNKQTNESRAYTEVTVADAVQIHMSTMRYGVDLGVATNETFESRIDRLEGSANAPVDVPVVGAPLEVYSF